MIEGITKAKGEGVVAIDDVRVLEGKCFRDPNKPDILHDFEEDGSGFTNVKGSTVQWETFKKGVESDHTLGTSSGHYAELNFRSVSGPNIGQITSPVYYPVGKNTTRLFIFLIYYYSNH